MAKQSAIWVWKDNFLKKERPPWWNYHYQRYTYSDFTVCRPDQHLYYFDAHYNCLDGGNWFLR
jgi:hypothetical protein